ncbi:MAG: hypothetical protein F6J94_09870 [Moorea sp. SIO1F2]|uniref:hypothetical protein n=1 Tax=unclassified Moorena TaxID=2683338 RepID=UPI0013BC1317|nr:MULTISPECIES: hypothetical protein [unclassified Moorena]NEN98061.1 hypothetical protein [Moorena sp. SIO3I7]NEO22029.1 hypothetical protein [Moorena sp. SIO4A5]NEQ59549.1 hypothetical protein [Moorena sp. SIO4A1]NEO06503.1 hypothetical protein [Moorena sp. SIO3I8]NEP23621.1 hypothetical protein [Moorena sp. SIO3I6]
MESLTIAMVEWIIKLFRVYLVAGLIFAVPFVIFGVQRVDPNVHGWAIGFRIMIIPGVTAFWPMFATRLLRGKTLPTERNAHRISAKRLT